MSNAKLLLDFAQISRIARFVRQHGRAADYLQVRDLGEISQNPVMDTIDKKVRLIDARTDKHLWAKTYEQPKPAGWQPALPNP